MTGAAFRGWWAAGVTLSLLAAACGALLAWHAVTAREHDALARQIEMFRAVDRVAPVVSTIAALEAVHGRGGALRFLLTAPGGGTPLAGNLRLVQDARRLPRDRPLTITDAAGETLTVQVTALDNYFLLVLARPIELRDRLLTAAAGFAGFAAMASLFWLAAQAWGYRRLKAAVAELSDVIIGFDKDDMSRRSALSGPGSGTGAGSHPIDRLAVQVNAALDRIEQLVLSHRDFARRVMHDIKEPVARAQAALMDERDEHPAIARALASLDRFQATLRETQNIHEARSQQRDPPAAVALDTIVRDVLDHYIDVFADRDIAVVTRLEPAYVFGWYNQLWLMLSHLIDNAIKYQPVGGGIRVTLCTIAGETILEIADQGPGLTGMPARPGQLYERGPAGDGVAGSGIGLNSVMAIAALHDASMEWRDRDDAASGLIARLTFDAARSGRNVLDIGRFPPG